MIEIANPSSIRIIKKETLDKEEEEGHIHVKNAVPGNAGHHKKWTGYRQDWGQIHSQLEIYFEERLTGKNL